MDRLSRNHTISPIEVEDTKSRFFHICLGIGLDLPSLATVTHLGIGILGWDNLYVTHIPITGEGSDRLLEYRYGSDPSYNSVLEMPYQRWSEPWLIKFRVKCAVISFSKTNRNVTVTSCNDDLHWEDFTVVVSNATHSTTLNLTGKIKEGDIINVDKADLTGNVTLTIVRKNDSRTIASYNFTGFTHSEELKNVEEKERETPGFGIFLALGILLLVACLRKSKRRDHRDHPR